MQKEVEFITSLSALFEVKMSKFNDRLGAKKKEAYRYA